MSDYIIKVENLVKRFSRLVAVNGISFSVAPGEIFGFLRSEWGGQNDYYQHPVYSN